MPVPQEPRQATARTQPFPRGDAVVPQMIEMAPEGLSLANEGRIFTPFVGPNPTIVKPGIWGGANWPPSAYDPVQQRLYVCASSVVNGYTGGGDPNVVVPGTTPDLYNGGAIMFTRLARTGIIAALDVTTNRLAWRYRWTDQCYSGTLVTRGELLFVGRADGRLTALDLDQWYAALGIPDWRRHACPGQYVRAQRQAVRHRVFRRQCTARVGARRQRLVVRSRRNAAASTARHRGAAIDGCSGTGRHGAHGRGGRCPSGGNGRGGESGARQADL